MAAEVGQPLVLLEFGEPAAVVVVVVGCAGVAALAVMADEEEVTSRHICPSAAAASCRDSLLLLNCEKTCEEREWGVKVLL